jgi:uncharacterized protein (DUF934 family)
MAQSLIHQRKLTNNSWIEASAPSAETAGLDVMVPFADWKAHHAAWLSHTGRMGVLLEPDHEPADLREDLSRLSLIAIRFPVFTDGRGYSIARLLRERYGYTGELRAVGDIMRDQLFYMSRVGFDAFLLREGEVAEEALAAFDSFSEAYQVSVERPNPLFRRRVS